MGKKKLEFDSLVIKSIKPLGLRLQKKEEKPKIENCICNHKNYHTPECKTHRRRINQYKNRNTARQKLRKQNKCIYCKADIKPIMVYPQYCEKHNKQINGGIPYARARSRKITS